MLFVLILIFINQVETCKIKSNVNLWNKLFGADHQVILSLRIWNTMFKFLDKVEKFLNSIYTESKMINNVNNLQIIT